MEHALPALAYGIDARLTGRRWRLTICRLNDNFGAERREPRGKSTARGVLLTPGGPQGALNERWISAAGCRRKGSGGRLDG